MKLIRRFIALKMSILRVDAAIIKRKKVKRNVYPSIAIGSKTIAEYVGGFSKICVAIFAFLSGYAMYYTYVRRGMGGYRHSLKKLSVFLLTYWIILFLLFIPVMCLTGVYRFSLKELFFNLFGIETTYCKIAWYVRFYIELVITFPIWLTLYTKIKKYFKVNKSAFIVLIFIEWSVSAVSRFMSFRGDYFVNEYISYLSIVCFGFFFAENDIITQTRLYFSKKKSWLTACCCSVCVAIVFLARGIVKSIGAINMDFLYAPIFILSILLILDVLHNNFINNILTTLGKYSLEIWFLHAIFFIGNPVVQRIGYWPRADVLILVWVLILLLPFASVFRKIKEEVVKAISI